MPPRVRHCEGSTGGVRGNKYLAAARRPGRPCRGIRPCGPATNPYVQLPGGHMMLFQRRTRGLALATLFALLLSPLSAGAQGDGPGKKKKTTTPAGTPVLWRAPVESALARSAGGAGRRGDAARPRPRHLHQGGAGRLLDEVPRARRARGARGWRRSARRRRARRPPRASSGRSAT